MALALAIAGGLACPPYPAWAGSEEHEFLLFDEIPLDEAEAHGANVDEIRHKLRNAPKLEEVRKLVPDLEAPIYQAPPVKDGDGNVIGYDFSGNLKPSAPLCANARGRLKEFLLCVDHESRESEGASLRFYRHLLAGIRIYNKFAPRNGQLNIGEFKKIAYDPEGQELEVLNQICGNDSRCKVISKSVFETLPQGSLPEQIHSAIVKSCKGNSTCETKVQSVVGALGDAPIFQEYPDGWEKKEKAFFAQALPHCSGETACEKEAELLQGIVIAHLNTTEHYIRAARTRGALIATGGLEGKLTVGMPPDEQGAPSKNHQKDSSHTGVRRPAPRSPSDAIPSQPQTTVALDNDGLPGGKPCANEEACRARPLNAPESYGLDAHPFEKKEILCDIPGIAEHNCLGIGSGASDDPVEIFRNRERFEDTCEKSVRKEFPQQEALCGNVAKLAELAKLKGLFGRTSVQDRPRACALYADMLRARDNRKVKFPSCQLWFTAIHGQPVPALGSVDAVQRARLLEHDALVYSSVHGEELFGEASAIHGLFQAATADPEQMGLKALASFDLQQQASAAFGLALTQDPRALNPLPNAAYDRITSEILGSLSCLPSESKKILEIHFGAMQRFYSDQKSDLPGISQAWQHEILRKADELYGISQDLQKAQENYRNAGCGDPAHLENHDAGGWKSFFHVHSCESLGTRVSDLRSTAGGALNRNKILSSQITMTIGKKSVAHAMIDWLGNPTLRQQVDPWLLVQKASKDSYDGLLSRIAKSCEPGFQALATSEMPQIANPTLMSDFMSCEDLYANPKAGDLCDERHSYAKNFCPMYFGEVGKENTKKIIAARTEAIAAAAFLAATPLIGALAVAGGASAAVASWATLTMGVGSLAYNTYDGVETAWNYFIVQNPGALRREASLDFQSGRDTAGEFLMRSESARKDLAGFVEHELLNGANVALAILTLKATPRPWVMRKALTRIRDLHQVLGPEERAAFSTDLLNGRIQTGPGKFVQLSRAETAQLWEALRTAELRFEGLAAARGAPTGTIRPLTESEQIFQETKKSIGRLKDEERQFLKMIRGAERGIERSIAANGGQPTESEQNHLKQLKRAKAYHRAKLRSYDDELFDAKLTAVADPEEQRKMIDERLMRGQARKERIATARKAGVPEKDLDQQFFRNLDHGIDDDVEIAIVHPDPEVIRSLLPESPSPTRRAATTKAKRLVAKMIHDPTSPADFATLGKAYSSLLSPADLGPQGVKWGRIRVSVTKRGDFRFRQAFTEYGRYGERVLNFKSPSDLQEELFLARALRVASGTRPEDARLFDEFHLEAKNSGHGKLVGEIKIIPDHLGQSTEFDPDVTPTTGVQKPDILRALSARTQDPEPVTEWDSRHVTRPGWEPDAKVLLRLRQAAPKETLPHSGATPTAEFDADIPTADLKDQQELMAKLSVREDEIVAKQADAAEKATHFEDPFAEEHDPALSKLIPEDSRKEPPAEFLNWEKHISVLKDIKDESKAESQSDYDAFALAFEQLQLKKP